MVNGKGYTTVDRELAIAELKNWVEEQVNKANKEYSRSPAESMQEEYHLGASDMIDEVYFKIRELLGE